MSNVIQEYLVRLGFESNEPQFRRLQGMLDDAERSMSRHVPGILKWAVALPAGVAAAFGSVSVAVAGMMDKVAQADQGYRLMGLRMLMTTDSARKLDMITKALGADLPTIVWDRELHERAVQMSQDIDRMSKGLGPEFPQQMRNIRDMRFEFQRLGVGLEFLAMRFTFDLAKKLNLVGANNTLRQFVDSFEDRIGHYSERLAAGAKPILKLTWDLAKAGVETSRAIGTAFVNIVGAISGDKSIQGVALSFDSLGKAIGHVGGWIVDVAGKLPGFVTKVTASVTSFFQNLPQYIARVQQWFQELRGWIMDARDAVGTFADALSELSSGHLIKASELFKKAGSEFRGQGENVEAAKAGKPLPGSERGSSGSPSRSVETPDEYARRVAKNNERANRLFYNGRGVESGNPYARKLAGVLNWLTTPLDPKTLRPLPVESPAKSAQNNGVQEMIDAVADGHRGSAADVRKMIDAAADRYAVPRSLAHAVAKQESGYRQDAVSQKGAIGVMQLMPGTANDLGVNPKDPAQNIEGGVRLLADLLKRYNGDLARALAAYNAGPSRVDHTDPSKWPQETKQYVPNVLRLQQEYRPMPADTPAAIPAPAAAPSVPPSPTIYEQMKMLLPISYVQRTPAAPWLQPAYDDTALARSAARASRETGEGAVKNPLIPAAWIGNKTAMPEASHRDWSTVMAYMQRPIPTTPTVVNRNVQLTVDVGGIYVTKPGSDEYSIRRAVVDGVRDAMKDETQWDLAQLNPVW